MKMFMASLATETNSFSPIPTGWSGFKEHLYSKTASRGEAGLYATAVTAWRNIAEDKGWEVRLAAIAEHYVHIDLMVCMLAEKLAADLKIDISAYASEMFEAKSDVGAFSDAELLRMDSKEYAVGGKEFRVSVLETTAPKLILDRKDSLMAAMVDVAKEDGADQVLLFVVDILNEEATLLVPNDLVKGVAEKSFGATVSGDTVVLPGIMSRKKQIIPNLKV